MRPGRLVVLILGCLLVLPGLGMLAGGGGLALAYAVGADDDGFIDARVDDVTTRAAAITGEDLTLDLHDEGGRWLLDALDLDVRLRVTSHSTERALFVGIAREADVDRFLAGVAHDEVAEIDDGRPRFRRRMGGEAATAPGDADFWVEQSSGRGTRQVVWRAREGRWAVVVMNADGSPGVAVDAEVGARSDATLPFAFTLLGSGLLLTAGAVIMIAIGAAGLRPEGPEDGDHDDGHAATPGPLAATPDPNAASPVRLTAALDPALSRWMWLVKWFLAIPHVIVLGFLWIAFSVLTVVAGVAILFTGRYPRGIFDFNVGVLRWSWRVSYYSSSGGLGTDRYPPFSLADDPTYPARLDIAPPERLSRGLVLVKWWLLAIPQYIVVGLLVGGFAWDSDGDGWWNVAGGGGLLGLLTLVAALVLAFTGTYQRGLFDLIVGLNRWVYRVIAYAALMTDRYPPFHLDQGGDEPAPPAPPISPASPPATAHVDAPSADAVPVG